MLPSPFLVSLFICLLSAYCGQGGDYSIRCFQERMCSQNKINKKVIV